MSEQFHVDNAWQSGLRDAMVKPYYKKHFAVAVPAVADMMAFNRAGIDTFLLSHDGSLVAVEEKIIRWPGRVYDSFFLEVSTPTGLPGWMHKKAADRLFYCFEQADGSLVGYWIDFQALRRWFWEEMAGDCKWHEFTGKDGAVGRLVEIKDVVANVATKRIALPKPQ